MSVRLKRYSPSDRSAASVSRVNNQTTACVRQAVFLFAKKQCESQNRANAEYISLIFIRENSHSHFIENFNRQFRKETKSKAVFPNDDALLKMLYLAQIDITKKWSGRHRDRGEIHSQLEVFFADRLPKQQKSRFISRIK